MTFDSRRPGHWESLERDPSQRVRYSHILSVIAERFPNGAQILDVGCGSGELAGFVRKNDEYLGVEPNSRAIAAAEKLHSAQSVSFCQETAEDFVPPKRFDVIVFTEVLYYAKDPIDVLRRYIHFLTNRGFMIVTIYLRPDDERLQQRLKRWALRFLTPHVPRSNRHCTSLVDGYAFRAEGVASHVTDIGVQTVYRVWTLSKQEH